MNSTQQRVEPTRFTELITAKPSKTHLALAMLKKYIENMNLQSTGRINVAFTLIELLVVIAVLVIFFSMIDFGASPNARRKAQRINCVNNLKESGLAFRDWERDNGDKFPTQISATNVDAIKLIATGNAYVLWQMMSNQLSTPKILYCTADTEQVVATNFTTGFSDANISYFLNLDGNEASPQMILTGDDNLAVNGVPARTGPLTLSTNSSVAWTSARHKFVGNIGIADGSVQQVTTHGLFSAISNAASPSRLIIP
jgi:type II secretory pathway pseudopilin PulG